MVPPLSRGPPRRPSRKETPDDERIADFVAKYWQSPQAPEPGAACTGGLDGPGRVA